MPEQPEQQENQTSETAQNVEPATIETSPSAVQTPDSSAQTSSSHGKKVGLIVAVIVGIAISFATGVLGGMLAGQTSPTKNVTGFASPKEDGNKVVTAQEQDVSRVVDTVSPSVVSIVISTTSDGLPVQAAGTGMIVSKNGYVLTNRHVVSSAKSVTVLRSDGTIYRDVPVVGTDPLNDIAFVKIPNVTDLPAVTLGDSKTVRVGQGVIAIGNALGEYQNTVTTGIISGLGRPVTASSSGGDGSDAESLSDLLQTDAAINEGNSGGPLLNMSGQVIGMNTAIASDAQSIGFAIPIGAVKGMLNHLLKNGNLARAYIGVEYVPITPDVKAQYNLSVSDGDYVNSVRAGSPAATAGLKAKDIITQVNGVSIAPGKSISTLIGEFQPGDTVSVAVLRDGKTTNVNVTLGSYNG